MVLKKAIKKNNLSAIVVNFFILFLLIFRKIYSDLGYFKGINQCLYVLKKIWKCASELTQF